MLNFFGEMDQDSVVPMPWSGCNNVIFNSRNIHLYIVVGELAFGEQLVMPLWCPLGGGVLCYELGSVQYDLGQDRSGSDEGSNNLL